MPGPAHEASAQRPIFRSVDAYLSAEHEDQHDGDDDEDAEQAVGDPRLPLVLPEPGLRAVARVPALGRLAGPVVVVGHLPDLPTRDRARDHKPLDLGGALEDRVDLRVAVHALDRVLARVAVAAEDLDRALRRPDRDLAGLE